MNEAQRVYRRMALFDLPFEVKIGLNLSFYRTFAIPGIAGLLARTGEITRRPDKRAMDTGLLMYELIDSGPTSDRGRQVIRMLNAMHRRWPIAADDYTYVLATFIVPTCRWIDTYGWRSTTAEEREAITAFYWEVGRLMGIRRRPRSYEEAEAILDDYEAAHMHPSPEGTALMAATAGVLADRLPRPVRRLAPRLTSLMIDDRLCDALGLTRPGRRARLAFRVAMAARALVVRRRARRTEPIFKPGRSGSSVYPEGYQLSDLGVDAKH